MPILVFSASRLSALPSQAISTIRYNIFSRTDPEKILYYTTASAGIQPVGSIRLLTHRFKNRYLQLGERIWRAHQLQPDILLFTGDFFEIFFYLLRPRAARTMLHLNGPVLQTLKEFPYPTGRTRLIRWLGIKFFIRRVDSIAAISEYVAASVKNFEVPADVYTIFNGVDLNQFKPFEHNPTAGPLVFAGSLIRRKRPDMIVALARRLPKLHFVIVGDLTSESDPDIARCITETPNILWHRHLDRQAMAKLLSTASLFIFPSLFEGFGMVIAEALASGCPVIATRHGGIPELIEPGASGMLITHTADSAKELDDFYQSINQLLNDPARLSSMKLQARESALKRYDWNNLATQWAAAIYEQTAKRR